MPKIKDGGEALVRKPKIAVVGAGKVGSALALLLNRQGYPVTGVASKSISSARRVAGRSDCRRGSGFYYHS